MNSLNAINKIKRYIIFNFKTFLHILAMHCPDNRICCFLHKLRGIRLGKNIGIAHMVFLEEACPELITINDGVHLGPGVIIVAHDSSYQCICPGGQISKKKVIIGRNVYIGAGAIILPGVTVGSKCIIGAGSVVTKDIPPNSVALGVPAKVMCTVFEWLDNKNREI